MQLSSHMVFSNTDGGNFFAIRILVESCRNTGKGGRMSRPKVLILDDDQDFLDVCRQMLSVLPNPPEILTVNSGSRALSLLESEPFALLLTDLRMPKMDGFQVLAIVRKRLPLQRIVVMTGLSDDQSRSRAYEIGIDLFVEKPKSQSERQLFLECIESMLERDARQTGFRGVVEHKALVDIIQLECLTQSSAVAKITSGRSVGYIWFRNGEIIDAATATAKAEKAFKEILSWKVGNFDLLAPEPARARTIFASAQGLLLDTAQAIDEAKGAAPEPLDALPPQLAGIDRAKGLEFLLVQEGSGKPEHWGCADANGVAAWAQRLLQEYRALGEALDVKGGPVQIAGYGPQRHVAVASRGKETLVAGFNPDLEAEQVRSAFHKVLTQWAS